MIINPERTESIDDLDKDCMAELHTKLDGDIRMKKFELTTNTKIVSGRTLYQIIALRSFSDVSKGDLGGWVETEDNLSQDGDAWIYDNAIASDNSRVSGDARVSGNGWIYDNVRVSGITRVSDNAWVFDDALVFGGALAFDAYFEQCNPTNGGEILCVSK